MKPRDLGIVTVAYWGLTITDGALRMLVLLHFHTLGFTPVQLALLFLLYELCGMFTNFLGGWIATRTGLRTTLFGGLGLQIVAMIMLSGLGEGWGGALAVVWVMSSQALSGVAKDLTKLSAKSSVKLVKTHASTVSDADADAEGRQLFRWVAWLTGSKNALKGLGFFIGAALLQWLGFQPALWVLAFALGLVLLSTGLLLRGLEAGRSTEKVKMRQLFSKTHAINQLSAARFFLFAARDIWFVVALPVFFTERLGWDFWQTGGFLALWVVGYGVIQAAAPRVVKKSDNTAGAAARSSLVWAAVLLLVCLVMAAAAQWNVGLVPVVLGGLAVFGVVFALNSSIHSYLILAYSDADRVTADVGFYYTANAAGRLVGTLLSGLTYLGGGLAYALWASAAALLVCLLLTTRLPMGK